MEEENFKPEPESKGETSDMGMPEPAEGLGKFKSVEALMDAYGQLEAEFTRRSQRLKALEKQLAERVEPAAPTEEELFQAVSKSSGVRARVLSDYLQELRGVPLLAGGAAVPAPAKRPSSIAEAGSLALGYFKSQN